jgi:hypothetical protein
VLPPDLEGFVNIIPGALNYTGPEVLMQEIKQLNILIKCQKKIFLS